MTDAWNPDDECLAHIKAPRIIGGPSHHHVCRKIHDHTTVDVLPAFERDVRLHRCGCGATW